MGPGGSNGVGRGNGYAAPREVFRPGPARPGREPGVSGRRFLLVAVVALAAAAALLYLAMLRWRDRYRERAAFGAAQVAPAVDPLSDLEPPGVPPGAWRRAVADTRAMLVALTASGLLDIPQMRDLRDDLRRRAAGADDATAVAVLAGIWDDMERRAGPVIAPGVPPPPGSRRASQAPRPPRPALLPPSKSVTQSR